MHITNKNVINLYLIPSLLIFFIAIFPSTGKILSNTVFLFLFFISLLFLIPSITDVELAFTLGINADKYIFTQIITIANIIYFKSIVNLK